MSNNYSLTSLATALGLMWAGNAVAINPPTVPSQELTDGETYLLMNYARPAKYWTRTSWDGAYYLLDYSAWENNTKAWQPIDFTARKNEDGTWSFVYTTAVNNPEEEGLVDVCSLCLPSGSGNLKALKETETDGIVKWNVTAGDYPGYYRLCPGDNNPNELVIGHPLHLNGGGEYAIIYFEGNGWGFDIYGGVKEDENGDIVFDDMEYPVFNNYDHTNWCFVHGADIEAYNTRAEMYVAITAAEDFYADAEGFEEGAKGLIETAGAIYEIEGSTLADVKPLIDAKRALYDEIMADEELNETGDAALQAAIDKAVATFNGSNDVAELTNAKEALHNALKVYLSGEGDFTSFGKNMSFEDLSAQNNATTTGVVNAPAGWNLYLNGELCNDAASIKAKGVNAWCGINQDGTGAKDGQHIFGIWNGAMPEVELSQTIDGLENGTYYISAAVMVGANGNGSRMTTQRLFGNLNSALFGYEDDYNKEYLNPSEVYEYAGLSEPTTDTELQEMSVSAYVYDGTLTFGFRTNGKWQAVAARDGSNGAGGDGWFKIDNFRIQYMGYDPSDAENILAYFQEALYGYAALEMQDVVADKLLELYALCPETPEEINAAILECKNYIGTVKASADAYTSMREYIEKCEEYMYEYGDYSGIKAYTQAVTDAVAAMDDNKLDEAGLAALRASLEDALAVLMLSGVSEGKDVTELLVNPSFEDLRSQNGNVSDGVAPAPYGWTLKLNGEECSTVAEINAQGVTGWCAANRGDNISNQGAYDYDGNLIERQPTDGDHVWGIWTDNVPEVELSQTITGIPAGTYILTADVMIEWNWAGDCMTTQRIFANDALCMYGAPWDYLHNTTPDMEAAIAADRQAGFEIEADYWASLEEDVEDEETETRAATRTPDAEIDAYRMINYMEYDYSQENALNHTLRTLAVKFVVGEDGVAKIGFRTNNVNREGKAMTEKGRGWFKVDNFTLYYDSSYIPTAIADINAVSQSPFAFYTIDGMRLSTPRRGINIVRQGGKAHKVFVK